jgi:hypothetical protein
VSTLVMIFIERFLVYADRSGPSTRNKGRGGPRRNPSDTHESAEWSFRCEEHRPRQPKEAVTVCAGIENENSEIAIRRDDRLDEGRRRPPARAIALREEVPQGRRWSVKHDSRANY